MRVLVCGGRDFSDYEMVKRCMALIHDVSIVIQGGARGADELGKRWAIDSGVHYAEVPAYWDLLGRGAGPARNRAMLLLKPELVVAFAGGRGTAHMMEAARRAGVTVWDTSQQFTVTPAGRAALEEGEPSDAMMAKIRAEIPQDLEADESI